MRSYKSLIVFLIIAAIVAGIAGCGGPGAVVDSSDDFSSASGDEKAADSSVSAGPANRAMAAENLMAGVSTGGATGRVADDAFASSVAEFAIELFKESVDDGGNSLISPLSVLLALAMTANGAGGDTLAQMEVLLGGDIPLVELNEYLLGYVEGLPSTNKSTLSIANSIWFRDQNDVLRVDEGFLQRNADYYGASAYKAPFDAQTVSDINNWVKENTDGMIDTILDKIDAADMMFLLNAVMFDAEWNSVYYKENISEGDFTDISGAVQVVDFMYSTESQFLDDGMATGFIKHYANGDYSFAALLPNEGVALDAYIDSLTGDGFLSTIQNAEAAVVHASMPKFEFEYELGLNDALTALGMPDAFDIVRADFSDMAVSSEGNLFISLVLHKTFISVDELGTKAGAVTMVAMGAGSAMPVNEKNVRLDRPFVFAIIDNATSLPIFIGTVLVV